MIYMKIFKIGQKVVALNETNNVRCQPRVKGQIYEVLDTMFCSQCGSQIINITSAESPIKGILCGCGNIMPNKNKQWTYSEHFASLLELDSLIKEYERVEDYEMCGKLLKLMQENQ
jgi:hypothetical protein